MNLRSGTVILLNFAHWHDDIHPDDRTPQNANIGLEVMLVDRCEWDAPGQKRMQVRLRDHRNRELLLTPHELELNGATQ